MSGEPSAGEARALETPDDVLIGLHDVPYEPRSIVLDHDQDRPLVDAEVVDVEPAECGIDRAHCLLARCGESWVERIEKPVRSEQFYAVRSTHLHECRDCDLGRERH